MNNVLIASCTFAYKIAFKITFMERLRSAFDKKRYLRIKKKDATIGLMSARLVQNEKKREKSLSRLFSLDGQLSVHGFFCFNSENGQLQWMIQRTQDCNVVLSC